MSTPSVYIARQPIFDAQMQLHAYELLFRNSERNQATINDGEHATAEVMMSALTDIGLQNIVGSHQAYINMTYDFLTGKLLVPQLKDKLVLEILEDVVPDDRLISNLTALVKSGYTIALDDFVYQPGLDPLLDLATVVKLDVMALNHDEIEEQIKLIRPFKVQLLAEKVETNEEFKYCKSLGFDYFQGYFFCRPEILKGKRHGGNRVVMINLMAKLQDPEVQINDLVTLISQDASLAYRLLKYINSAFFGISSPITSMKHAITLAGLQTIKHWSTLALMLKLGNEKTSELVMTGMVRARMCQILGSQASKFSEDEFFTVGLFSILDALLDTPKEEILDSLPLTDETINALLNYEGTLGHILRLVMHYEQGMNSGADLKDGHLAAAYIESIKWVETHRASLC